MLLLPFTRHNGALVEKLFSFHRQVHLIEAEASTCEVQVATR